MVAARMKIDANPWVVMFAITGTSAIPTSMAMSDDTDSPAIATGRLSVVPPSMQVRPPTIPGGKNPGSAHDA